MFAGIEEIQGRVRWLVRPGSHTIAAAARSRLPPWRACAGLATPGDRFRHEQHDCRGVTTRPTAPISTKVMEGTRIGHDDSCARFGFPDFFQGGQVVLKIFGSIRFDPTLFQKGIQIPAGGGC
jgi:hypothetical protein